MRRCFAPLIAAVVAFATTSHAQINPAYADLAEATEQARSILQMERKLIVSQGLALTPEQSSAFWPLYDRYMADLKAAGDLRVKVITDYAANYASMSDATARELVNDSLKYQKEIIDIRKSYLRKFRKVLQDTQVARFYQLENKLDAITNFALARQIPLVPQPGASPAIAQP